MSTEGLIIGGIIFLITLGWIAMPLIRQRKAARGGINLEKTREQILMRYERVLNNIRDLDEDHATGKMPTQDYQVEREQWMQEGSKVLAELDALQGTKTQAVPLSSVKDNDVDDKIEDAVAAYRSRAKQT